MFCAYFSAHFFVNIKKKWRKNKNFIKMDFWAIGNHIFSRYTKFEVRATHRRWEKKCTQSYIFFEISSKEINGNPMKWTYSDGFHWFWVRILWKFTKIDIFAAPWLFSQKWCYIFLKSTFRDLSIPGVFLVKWEIWPRQKLSRSPSSFGKIRNLGLHSPTLDWY